jgi:hypothetical protein
MDMGYGICKLGTFVSFIVDGIILEIMVDSAVCDRKMLFNVLQSFARQGKGGGIYAA